MIATRGAGRGIPAASKEDVQAASHHHARSLCSCELVRVALCRTLLQKFRLSATNENPFGPVDSEWCAAFRRTNAYLRVNLTMRARREHCGSTDLKEAIFVAQHMQAMSSADAMEDVNGNGVAETGVSPTDKDAIDRPNKTGDRESETQVVDKLSAALIKQAENAEEKRQKDQAFIERYDARVQEVRRDVCVFALLEIAFLE